MKINFKVIIVWFIGLMIFASSFTSSSVGEIFLGFLIAGAFAFWGVKIGQKNLKNYNIEQKLYSIQHIVIHNIPPNKKMPLNQILNAIKLYVSQHTKIYDDCERLLKTTNNPKVYFERAQLLEHTLKELIQVEDAAELTPAPTSILNSFRQSYSKLTNDFLARSWAETVEKANLLNTDRGKAGKLERFFREMAPYQGQMTKQSKEYFQSMKEAYLNDKDYIASVTPLEKL